MLNIDAEAIAELTVKKLSEARSARYIDPKTHEKHHDWISKKVQDEIDAKAMRRKIIESATIWAVLIFAGFVSAAVWHEIKTLLGK